MPQSNQIHKPDNDGIRLTGPRQITVEHVQYPLPGPGQVLIKTQHSLISTGTELALYDGQKHFGAAWQALCDYPRDLGYSNVGCVEQTGPDVDPSWMGKRVHNHGSHQAYALVPATKLAVVPESVSDEQACFTTLAKVAMNGLRRAQASWGERIAVIGLGIVGQLATRLCLHLGASEVHAIDPSALRVDCLPQHPALRSYTGAIEDYQKQIHDLDLVIEASGHPQLIASLPELLREQGRLLLLSSPRGETHFNFHDGCNRRSLSIIGAHSFSHPIDSASGNPWTSARHAELFLGLLKHQQLSVEELISLRAPYSQATEVYQTLFEQRAQHMGVIFKW